MSNQEIAIAEAKLQAKQARNKAWRKKYLKRWVGLIIVIAAVTQLFIHVILPIVTDLILKALFHVVLAGPYGWFGFFLGAFMVFGIASMSWDALKPAIHRWRLRRIK